MCPRQLIRNDAPLERDADALVGILLEGDECAAGARGSGLASLARARVIPASGSLPIPDLYCCFLENFCSMMFFRNAMLTRE